jgi:flagellar hook-basal body complex protein FliE
MPDFRIEPFRPELPQIKQGAATPTTPREPVEGMPLPGGLPPEEVSFRDSVKNFISDVDKLQKISKTKIEDFIAGEISDVHEVMIAVEKASTSFQLLMELRNKMLDAYQEIKRMSV